MDLTLTQAEESFRAEARDWLAENVPAEPLASMDTAEGFAQHRTWERRLFEAGYATVSWPSAYGGRAASVVEWLLIEEEYHRAGAPGRVSQNGVSLLAPALFEFGTTAQRERFLRPMARADEVWAQAWSEPEAGSDLAALRSTAARCDGGWRLSGQKTWSSRASYADWAFGLFRTDPGAGRHRGLTYFLVPLTAEGITVRPIAQLDGDPGFAEIFLDDVFLADDCAPGGPVLGDVNAGWQVAMSTTGSERGLSLRSPGRFLATAERLISLCARSTDDPALREDVARAWIDAQAYRLQTFATVGRLLDGGSVGAESSLTKLFWSQLDERMHEVALRMLGPRGELTAAAPDAVDGGRWLDGYLFSLAGPIYAGTNEIQRNVIAERLLGLPREPR
jgi:alkylation response protein AidB-like acyl-CoA dehydrogenase